MKVLMVEGAHELGGQARHVFDLAKGLVERGHEVSVACARAEAAARLQRAAIPCYRLPFRPVFDFSTLAALVRIIRSSDFDIVHSHGVRAGLVARVAAKLAGGCRIIHTVHAMAEDMAPGRGLSALPAKWLYRSVDSRLGKGTEKIITVSEEFRGRTICRIIGPGKVVTVHSGLDLSQFDSLPSPQESRHRLGLPIGCKVVGTVARFTKQKNLGYLVKAARIVCAQRDDVCFVLVGDGTEYDQVKSLAQDQGISHRVFLPGYLGNTAGVLPGFDVFALSSLWEGHPLSLLEAMAAGLPVVATQVNGITETVLHGETGLMVPLDDPVFMADALLTLLADAETSARMGEAGKRRVRDNFSLDKMLRDVEAVYLDIVDRDSIGAPLGATE